jgi:hypothetical protein
MSSIPSTKTAAPFSRIVVRAGTPAAERYRKARETEAIARGFAPHKNLNLHKFPGRTIEHLTFTNVYLGGAGAWSTDDVRAIDASLAASMSDPHLNNVIAQYFPDGKPTTAFKPSRQLPGPLPHRVYRDTIEGFAAGLDQHNGLSGFDLTSTVFCFLLPKGVLLVDGTSDGNVRARDEDDDDDDRSPNVALHDDDAVDSRHGLGGYHGSIHARRGRATDTVYYAVAVYSEGRNGIPAFDRPWKSVCATLYHELQEARTDPDVEDAIRAGDTPKANDFVGWYSPHGGEIGDIPMDEAGANLASVMVEVPLVKGGTAPIQLMWSNAVGGPEGPIPTPHQAAARA